MKYFFCCICFFYTIVMMGQDSIVGGVLREDRVYDFFSNYSNYDGRKSALPKQIDWTSYCPYPQDQGKIPSCVGWALGYGAMTIEKAIQQRWTSRRKITQNAFSPLYIYNQITQEDCENGEGSYMSEALSLVKKNGNCLAKNFDPYINYDCSQQPTNDIIEEARNNSIRDFKTVFPLNATPENKILKVKEALSKKKPVVIAMKVSRSFCFLFNRKYWIPREENLKNITEHAMVVVGYDNNEYGKKGAFKLMSSWGQKWGDQGFIWVSYENFGKFCRYGYVIFLDKKSTASEEKLVVERNNDFAISSNMIYYNDLGQKLIAEAQLESPFHYVLSNKKWKLGHLFQLEIIGELEHQYIYVFSKNSKNKIRLHYPRKNKTKDKVSSKKANYFKGIKTKILIPSKLKGLKLTRTKDQLYILFSLKEIKNISNFISFLEKNNVGFMEAVHNFFRKKVVPVKYIDFDFNTIKFKNNRVRESDVFPLVIQIEGCVECK